MKVNTIRLLEQDCYNAQINYLGIDKPSTLFPASWTRKKVIDTLFEVLQDTKRIVYPDKTGKRLRIVGFSKSSLEIEVIFDPQRNKIISVYPTIKRGG
jgi:hypothetical protein